MKNLSNLWAFIERCAVEVDQWPAWKVCGDVPPITVKSLREAKRTAHGWKLRDGSEWQRRGSTWVHITD